MPRIASVKTAVPPHRITQEASLAVCQEVYGEHPHLRALLRVFQTSGVLERWFTFPVEYYRSERPFEERNRDYIEQAGILANQAARSCLAHAEVNPQSIDHLILVTTTGLATPSLDARLVQDLGLSRDCRRWPVFGLGCAGGAGALIRAADLVRADPGARVLVVAVELSGQVFTPKFQDPVDVIGSALFGEGAAAVLVTGDRVPHPGPRILTTRSHLFDNTAHIMGWKFTSDGMRLLLSQEIPQLIAGPLAEVVSGFLSGSETPPNRVRHWILHPGGRGIIDTYARVFGLSEDAQRDMRGSLAHFGNLASASVLFVLDSVLKRGLAPSERGLLLAVGPGFGTEMLMLEG